MLYLFICLYLGYILFSFLKSLQRIRQRKIHTKLHCSRIVHVKNTNFICALLWQFVSRLTSTHYINIYLCPTYLATLHYYIVVSSTQLKKFKLHTPNTTVLWLTCGIVLGITANIANSCGLLLFAQWTFCRH